MLLVALALVMLFSTFGAYTTYTWYREAEAELKISKERVRSLQRELNYYRPTIEWEK
jgi:hypothetical protein